MQIFLVYLIFYCGILHGAYLNCTDRYDCLKISECKRRHGNNLENFVYNYCGQNRFDEVCCPKNDSSTAGVTETTATTMGSTPGAVTTFSPDLKAKKKFLPYETCGWRNDSYGNKIYQGRNAAPGEFPWIVLLKIDVSGNRQAICGGTLISRWYVLTAAHCVYFYDHKKIKIILGAADLAGKMLCSLKENREPIERKADQVYVHPKYYLDKQLFGGKDIALIRMNKRIKFNDCIQPACLPFDDFGKGLSRENSILITAGWGTKGASQSPSSILQVADQYFVNFTECAKQYKEQRYLIPILKTQICTLGKRNARGLKGDSGGPLLSGKMMRRGDTFGVRFVLVGVMSSGPQDWNRTDAVPNIYTKVNRFLVWILKNINV